MAGCGFDAQIQACGQPVSISKRFTGKQPCDTVFNYPAMQEYITITTVAPLPPRGEHDNGDVGTPVIRYFAEELRKAASPLDRRASKVIKRIFDLLVSTAVLALIFPWLIPIIAILIRLDSKGPVFFLQKRNGRKGRLFTCIKFRSMKVNTEADFVPATPGDDRITRAGRLLRRYHIDEFPQFFNVLLGNMSVIGPRPHMISDNLKYESLIGSYALRHQVKPGISGLAQVRGFAGEILCLQKMQRRVEADLFYIRHWSLSMDVRIFFNTFRSFSPAKRSPNRLRETARRSSLHHALSPSSVRFDGAA